MDAKRGSGRADAGMTSAIFGFAAIVSSMLLWAPQRYMAGMHC
jgi:hypothetical protein